MKILERNPCVKNFNERPSFWQISKIISLVLLAKNFLFAWIFLFWHTIFWYLLKLIFTATTVKIKKSRNGLVWWRTRDSLSHVLKSPCSLDLNCSIFFEDLIKSIYRRCARNNFITNLKIIINRTFQRKFNKNLSLLLTGASENFPTEIKFYTGLRFSFN